MWREIAEVEEAHEIRFRKLLDNIRPVASLSVTRKLSGSAITAATCIRAKPHLISAPLAITSRSTLSFSSKRIKSIE